MDISKALDISASGMDAQSVRLRVIAENLANQDTTGSTPGADAYRRKLVTFENRIERARGPDTVPAKRIAPYQSPLPQRYDPSHPAADTQGYVRTSNVNSFIEV